MLVSLISYLAMAAPMQIGVDGVTLRVDSGVPTVAEAQIPLALSSLKRGGLGLPLLGAEFSQGCDGVPVRCDAGLQVHRGVVQEWWATSQEHLQHGWTLPTRPSGSGPLELGIDVGGTAVSVLEGRVALRTPGGPWGYGPVRAWDSSGRTLTAHLTVRDGDVGVIVDDASAVYPVYIDPIIEPHYATVAPPSGYSFRTVMGSGDLNADGKLDIVALLTKAGTSDRIAVIYGAEQLEVNEVRVLPLPDNISIPTLTVADANGDGVDDVLVAKRISGEMFFRVMFGRPGTTLSPDEMVFTGLETDAAGFPVVADFDGDTIPDIIMSGINRMSFCSGERAGPGLTRDMSTCHSRTIDGHIIPIDACDITGDGQPEFLGFCYNCAVPELLVSSGGANDTFSVHPVTGTTFHGLPIQHIACADIDLDGYADVIFGQLDSAGPVVYRGSPDGLGVPTSPFTTANIDAVHVGPDLVGQGYPSVFLKLPDGYNGVGVYQANGNGIAGMHQIEFAGLAGAGFGIAMASGDVHGDGSNSIALLGYGSALYLFDVEFDADEDGITDSTDCDDDDASVYPGADDPACDGIDQDCDGEGGPDSDEDEDGLSFTAEVAAGTDPCDPDSDDDSVGDATEVNGPQDTDGDNIPNALDDDDDDDGVLTRSEDWNGDGDPTNDDADDDGVADYLDADVPGDGGDPDPQTRLGRRSCSCSTGLGSAAWLALVPWVLRRRRMDGPASR